MTPIGAGGARRASQLGRREDDLAVSRQEIRAGGGPFAARDGYQGRRAIEGAHAIDAIATSGSRARLKDQLAPAERPIRLGVLASKGELLELGEVRLGWERS